jgi:hypothetical protein
MGAENVWNLVWGFPLQQVSATTIVPNDVHHTISTAKYLHIQGTL